MIELVPPVFRLQPFSRRQVPRSAKNQQSATLMHGSHPDVEDSRCYVALVMSTMRSLKSNGDVS
jgi:hypothetical protein